MGGTIPIFNRETGREEEVVPVVKTDADWQAQLTPLQYAVARKQETEYAFTGKYHDCKAHGIYRCACCGTALFYRQPSSIPYRLAELFCAGLFAQYSHQPG